MNGSESHEKDPTILKTEQVGLSNNKEKIIKKIHRRKTQVVSAEQETYIGSGGKHSFHGVTYQLKLLMLFIIRAVNTGYSSFSLATEMEDADKFDDVIFSYPKNKHEPDCGRLFRFLQAKHTISDTSKKKIRAMDLLNETGGDFSLNKYFQSFRKISKNRKLIGESDEIKDLIICTNMCFKFGDGFGDFILNESIFEKIKNEKEEILTDDILQTELLRFKEDFQGKNEVILNLKNSLISLPKRFAEYILEEKEYFHEEFDESTNIDICQLYEHTLLNEVIDVSSGRFRSDFIDSINLTIPAKHFHDTLKTEYIKRRIHCGLQNEDDFWNSMKSRNFKLTGNLMDPYNIIKQPEKVSKKLTDLLRRNRDTKFICVYDDKSVIAQNMKVLAKFVFYKKDEFFQISPCFLNDEELPGNLNEFRTHLKKQLACFKIEFFELEYFRFEVSKFSKSHFQENTVALMENEVEYFLKKLVFAVNQVNETALDDILIEEIRKKFNETDVKYVYRTFLETILNWMKEKVGRYFSHKDANKLFDGIKREILRSVYFDLKDPVFNFIGREKELEKLKEVLNDSKNKGCHAVISQSVAISGLGGIGKSELARKYAEIHRSDYDNIVWIDGESSVTMESSFHRMAFDRLGILKINANGDDKKIQSIIEEVYQYFCGKINLFIFDNAKQLRSSNDGDDGILKYLPKSSELREFHFLITSCNQNWGSMNVLNLNNFTKMEALEFVRKSIGHIGLYNEKEANLLAFKLNYFPLAMQQAASYIREYNGVLQNVGETFTIADYLKLFEKACLDLLNYEFPMDSSDSYTKTTFTTWRITLKYIERLKFGEMAIKVLNLISYLAPDNIDMKWVSVALSVTCKIELGFAVELLKQYSMISIQASNLNIHRLVQLVTRYNAKEEAKEIDVLKKVLESAKLLEIEHSMSAWNYAKQHWELVYEFNDIPCHIINNLLYKFQYKLALLFAQGSVETLEKQLDKCHEIMLKTKIALGKALYFEGKFEESLKVYKYVYEIQKVSVGENDPETLITKNLIALGLLFLGKYELSLKIHMDVLEKGTKLFGDNHEDMLITKNNIAGSLYKLGDYKESLKYYEEIDEKQRKNLGVTDEFRLSTRHNIAILLIKKGKFDEALNILVDIYDKQQVSERGEGDPMTLSTKLAIASVLQKQGNYEEAHKKFEEVFEMERKLFGECHPNTLKTRGCLASVLIDLGRSEEALQICIEVYDSLKLVAGCEHEFTLNSMSVMAAAFQSQGNFKEALKITEDLYAKRKKILGEDHLLTSYSKCEIALNLCCVGMERKAHAILESVYRKVCNFLGEGHQESLAIKHSIGLVLYKQKKYEQALKTFVEVYEKRKVTLGESHPNTLSTKKCIDFLMRGKINCGNELFVICFK